MLTKGTARLEQPAAGGAMNRPVHTAAAQQCLVGGVDDGVDVEPRDVAPVHGEHGWHCVSLRGRSRRVHVRMSPAGDTRVQASASVMAVAPVGHVGGTAGHIVHDGGAGQGFA